VQHHRREVVQRCELDRAVVEAQRMGCLPIASFVVRKRQGVHAAGRRAVPRDSVISPFLARARSPRLPDL
jgi:hypothetical protein